MKKALALLMALAMVFSLTACGTGDAGSSDGATGEGVASAQVGSAAPGETAGTVTEGYSYVIYDLPLSDKVVEFEIWTQDFNDTCRNYFDTFNDTIWWQELEARTNIHINWTQATGTGGATALAIQVAAGDLPYDGIVGLGNVYNTGATGAYEDGLIIDLIDYAEYMPNYLNVLNLEPDLYLKNCFTHDGMLLAFDKLWTLSAAPAVGLAIRGDWLEDIGLDAPVTIEEYYDVLTAFKTEKGADSALWINYRGVTVGGMFGEAYDVDTYYGPVHGYYMMYQTDGTIHWSPLEEGFRSYLETMNQWFEEGLIYPDFCSAVADEMIADPSLFDGRTGCAFSPLALVPMLNMWSGEESADWVGAYIPRVTEDQTTHFLVGVEYVVSGNGLYITTSCEDVELLMRWADYFYSEEGQFYKNYGIEGESFNYENGESVLIKDNLFGDVFDGNTIATYTWYLGADNTWGLNDPSPRSISYSEAELSCIDRWLSQNDTAYKMPSGVNLSSEESAAFGNIWGDLSTYLEECMPAFIMGQKSFDEYDEFVEMLKTLGAEECIAVYQAALDRYNG